MFGIMITCTGTKRMSGMNKEGLVIDHIEPVYSKAIEGSLSMKALNNDYLLKE